MLVESARLPARVNSLAAHQNIRDILLAFKLSRRPHEKIDLGFTRNLEIESQKKVKIFIKMRQLSSRSTTLKQTDKGNIFEHVHPKFVIRANRKSRTTSTKYILSKRSCPIIISNRLTTDIRARCKEPQFNRSLWWREHKCRIIP